MEKQAYQKYIRISPRKLKVMIGSVKGMPPAKMVNTLSFINNKSAKILLKVMKQAMANARQVDSDISHWTIKTIQALKGPTYKRHQPVSRGRAHAILKRTSHLRIVLEKKEEVKKIEKSKLNLKTGLKKPNKPLAKIKKQNKLTSQTTAVGQKKAKAKE